MLRRIWRSRIAILRPHVQTGSPCPGPLPLSFQCKESEATGTSSGCHFGNPLSELQVSTPFVPTATQKNTRWSVGTFNDWMAHRNSLVSAESDRVPVGFLDRPDCMCNASVLNKWLTRFVLEGTCKSSGDPYPPETIYSILCGLYRYMQGKFGMGIPSFLS